MKNVILLFLLISVKCFSQDVYSDSVLVQASDLTFKKDTGQSANYTLRFHLGIHPVASLLKVKISFLNANGNVSASMGTYRLIKHAKGFYYLESGQTKLILHGQSMDIILKKTLAEYNEYEKVRINYTSTSGVTETLLFTILKL